MREVIAVDSWPSERETVCRHHRLSARSGLPSCRIAAYARFADQTLVKPLTAAIVSDTSWQYPLVVGRCMRTRSRLMAS